MVRLKSSIARYRALSLILLPALALPAEEATLHFDPAKSKIIFVLTDVLHTVHGSFKLQDGHISFDSAHGVLKGDVIVDAASGNSGSLTRDKRMTRDVLEAQRFPEIRFSPQKFTGMISPSDVSLLEVTGSFLIHGEAHHVMIPVQIQMSGNEITATGKFIVPYVDWGMKNPGNFLLKVGDKVEIDLTLVGQTKSPQTRLP